MTWRSVGFPGLQGMCANCIARVTVAIATILFACHPSYADTAPAFIAVTVRDIPKQTFAGFGASQPTDQQRLFERYDNATVRILARSVYGGLHANWLRLWVHSGADIDLAELKRRFRRSYVDNGYLNILQSQGPMQLLLAPARGEAPPSEPIGAYVQKLAQFVADLRSESGISIAVTGIANEPAGFSAEQIRDAVKLLRAELDARGLHGVGIVAPECASPDACATRAGDAIKRDTAAWGGLRGIATHSYNMGANPAVEGIVRGTGKEYWITEAGRGLPRVADERLGDTGEAATVAGRFLNDMNHAVTHWFWFIGIGHFDKHPGNDSGQVLARPDDAGGIQFNTKYFYLQQLLRNFDLGAVFYESAAEGAKPQVWGHGQKPAVVAAVARNPGGSWAIGVVNATGIPSNRQAQFYPAQNYMVEILLPRDAAGRVFDVRRSRATGISQEDGTVTAIDSAVRVAVSPHELVTLRSH